MKIKKITLPWQILIAFMLAVLFGYYFPDQVNYVSWMGTLFIRALKMIIIPLIFSSLVSGITNIGNPGNLGRLGLKTIGYYLVTSTIAILTGLLLVNVIQPGQGADLGLSRDVESLNLMEDSLGQTLIKIVPTNVFEAFSTGQMLSVIFFSILFGYFITKISPTAQNSLTGFFNAVFEVMMKITMFVIKFTPLGIFGIIAEQIAEVPSLTDFAGSMGKYMATVLASLLIHAVITLPLMVRLLSREKPYRHFLNMGSPLLTAFSTSSSSATLPLTMSAVEYNSGVSNKVSSFTLPLGATINMDGTALYECVAALFIAQAYGLDLSVAQQFIVVITALLASIGAAGIPMAGLVMISVILSAIGLPLEGVGLILAVDRILDMFRTATNVWSDSCGAVIIAKSEGEDLTLKN